MNNRNRLSIKEWHPTLQPREKLLNFGPQSLSDDELLALFIRTGGQGNSAIDIAKQAINQFNGLYGLLNAKQAEFCSISGLGPAKYCEVQGALELSKRYLASGIKDKNLMDHPDKVEAYLKSQLQELPQEVFVCLFLTKQHFLIELETLFKGTIDSATIYPREVVKSALRVNAAAVIFAHNHPSGDAKPSQADHKITKRLKEALDLVDIPVLDHVIIGKQQAISFARENWL